MGAAHAHINTQGLWGGCLDEALLEDVGAAEQGPEGRHEEELRGQQEVPWYAAGKYKIHIYKVFIYKVCINKVLFIS